MKRWISFLVIAATAIAAMNACGPSEEELERRRQARQDSLEQVRQDSIEQARRDSIAQARADSIEAARQRALEAERNRIEYDAEGNIALQVEAWRSLCERSDGDSDSWSGKAAQRLKTWKNRGYENAYVVKFGEEATGNIWYRIRLGRFSSSEMANKLARKLREEYNTKVWITDVNEGERVDMSVCAEM